jgi:hypothetical protein
VTERITAPNLEMLIATSLSSTFMHCICSEITWKIIITYNNVRWFWSSNTSSFFLVVVCVPHVGDEQLVLSQRQILAQHFTKNCNTQHRRKMAEAVVVPA